MYQEYLIVSRLPRVQLCFGGGITFVSVDGSDYAKNPFLYLFERSVSFWIAYGMHHCPCTEARRRNREQDEADGEEEESLEERQSKSDEAEQDEDDGGYDDKGPFELFVHKESMSNYRSSAL